MVMASRSVKSNVAVCEFFSVSCMYLLVLAQPLLFELYVL